ncbi:gas vesicle protein GvpO [Allostreptomyces psammosilenae]|uniref:Gas vesicle protein n=1 Tax=Allostreptomyces psammosilenae TaxID=1892865 RepID=A0A853A608_9ACTN|nr:gas vesicle protein [Allostreptomyces psammosilenae]NYI06121.1 hypothetical protein [Allostreptomyces psammosilenae]
MGEHKGRTIPAAVAVRRAVAQLRELVGHEPESVIAVRRASHGWEMDIEVVELARTPESSSVLASYHVELDADGGLSGYHRTRRYTREQVDQPAGPVLHHR